VDLFIEGIEITQAIQCFDQSQGYTQCPDNSLELTSGKPTFVRVYVGCTDCQRVSLEEVAVEVSVSLVPKCTSVPPAPPCGGSWWWWAGEVQSEPLDVNVLANKSLQELRDYYGKGSANFILPALKEGDLTVDARVNPNKTILETDYSNNYSPKLAHARIRDREPLKVSWALVEYTPSEKGGYHYTGSPLASTQQVGGVSWYMKKIYPMPVEYSQSPSVKYDGSDVRGG